MAKIISKHISVSFPLIGIPIKGFYTPFVSMPSNLVCLLMIRISDRDHEEVDKEICKHSLIGNDCIFGYINLLLKELGYKAISGDVRIECKASAPSISLFSITTIEILKNLTHMTYSDYMLTLKSLARFDEKVLGFDPGYIESLRCSYLFNSTCIAKGYNELVKIKAVTVDVEKV